MRNIIVAKNGDYYDVSVEGSTEQPTTVLVVDKYMALGCFFIEHHLRLGVTQKQYEDIIRDTYHKSLVIGTRVYVQSEHLGLNIVFKK